jgi:hypothetical protein
LRARQPGLSRTGHSKCVLNKMNGRKNFGVLIVTGLFLGLSQLTGNPLVGKAHADAPGYKVRLVESSALKALESVDEGESPQQDCAMVSMMGRDIMNNHSDDAEAMVVVSEAMETCSFDVPVAYFSKFLDSVEMRLLETPDSPTPCQDFISEFAIYSGLIGDGPERKNEDGTTVAPAEERVKAELSDRVKQSCPLVAGMRGF